MSSVFSARTLFACFFWGLASSSSASTFTAIADTPIYERPDKAAPVLGHLKVATEDIWNDPAKKNTTPTGWVAVMNTKYQPLPAGWVERTNIASPEDFKRVVGCWPIQQSEPATGEAPTRIVFKTNGTAVMYPMNVTNLAKNARRAHVYMAGNVVYIKADRRSKNTVGFFGDGYWALLYVYDPTANALKTIEWETDTQPFPKAALAGCNGVRFSR